MNIRTGETVYEEIMSLTADNQPVSSTTLSTAVYKDGQLFTGVTVNTALADDVRGVFTASWSSDTIGSYQIYVQNSVTNVVFVSDTIYVKPNSEFETNIYVGL